MAVDDGLKPCPDGQHSPTWDTERERSVCANCGLTASIIVDRFGHSFFHPRNGK